MDGVSIFTGNEWLEYRAYRLTNSFINYGSMNLLAVRVYDGLVTGGIYRGPVGIVTEDNYQRWQDKPRKKKGFFERLWGD